LGNTRDGLEKRKPKRKDFPHVSVEIRKRKGFTLMSEQGLKIIESTTQKTHEWVAHIAETLHMEKRDAYKSS
jgi:hypothetical protein